jgi:MFS superfamily sulfate permease-like transporter
LAKGHTELTIHHGDRSSVRVPHTQLCQLESHGCVTVVRLSGELTYFNAQAHAQTLKQLRCPAVVLSLRNLYYVDPDGVEELGEMIHETEVAGRQVVLAGVCDTVRSMLVQVPWFQRLEREGRVYDRTMSALTALGFPVGKGS